MSVCKGFEAGLLLLFNSVEADIGCTVLSPSGLGRLDESEIWFSEVQVVKSELNSINARLVDL